MKGMKFPFVVARGRKAIFYTSLNVGRCFFFASQCPVLSYIFGLVVFYFDSTVAGPERGVFRPGKDLEPGLELKLSGALSRTLMAPTARTVFI